jgi:hypothetical protein
VKNFRRAQRHDEQKTTGQDMNSWTANHGETDLPLRGAWRAKNKRIQRVEGALNGRASS